MKRLIIALTIMATAFTGGCTSKKQSGTEVVLETTLGNITIALYDQTPLHRDNFIKLVEEGYYDGVLFHRVISDFMIQTGDPDSKNARADAMLGQGGPDYTIKAEIAPELFHKRGAIAAARLGDAVNPKHESSGSQFYIVWGQQYGDEMLDMLSNRYGMKLTPEQREAYTTVGGTPHLDGAYTVFGEVVEGLDVVERIQNVETGAFDRPVKDICINKARVVD